jgi:hypothetical protein
VKSKCCCPGDLSKKCCNGEGNILK